METIGPAPPSLSDVRAAEWNERIADASGASPAQTLPAHEAAAAAYRAYEAAHPDLDHEAEAEA